MLLNKNIRRSILYGYALTIVLPRFFSFNLCFENIKIRSYFGSRKITKYTTEDLRLKFDRLDDPELFIVKNSSSPIKGLGLYSKVSIPNNTFVGYYEGQ